MHLAQTSLFLHMRCGTLSHRRASRRGHCALYNERECVHKRSAQQCTYSSDNLVSVNMYVAHFLHLPDRTNADCWLSHIGSSKVGAGIGILLLCLAYKWSATGDVQWCSLCLSLCSSALSLSLSPLSAYLSLLSLSLLFHFSASLSVSFLSRLKKGR